MKEIGEALKDARESIGISIEEAANDLKLRPSQIENIESGNLDAFKDVLYLKYFIRDYAKYLGLSYEDMVDEFNEYLFDCTSKLSLDDIKKAKKKIEKKQAKEEKISSPYTVERKTKIVQPYIILIILIIILIIVLLSFIKPFDKKENNDNNVLVVTSTN